MTKVADNIYMIDLMIGGVKNVMSSFLVVGETIGIIDCGPTSTINNLIRGIEDLGFKLTDISYIIATHIHLDHAGGAGALLKQASNAILAVHRLSLIHI